MYHCFMNNLSGRRQYFFLLISFLNFPYSNWPICIFSTQSDDSFMDKYSKKGNFWQASPAPQIKIFKKGKIHTELSPLSEKPKNLGIGLKLVEISCPKVLRTDRHSQILAQLKLRIIQIGRPSFWHSSKRGLCYQW